MAERQRLQKMLAAAGIASRRKSEEYIAAGRVKVNGNIAQIGDSVDPANDIVTLDGKEVRISGDKIYLALHKPRGFVTTMNDERNRKCVAMLVSDIPERVYPIGRLDKDSEGLLLMTNDGEFANKIMHPSRQIAKTYRVTVRPNITEEQITKICTGIVIDGQMTAPAKAKLVSQYENRAVVEIVLYEGRNREIRKMCEALGLEVARLKRIAEGPVRLGMLAQGKYRELKPEEIKGLMAEANKIEKRNQNDRNSTSSRRKSKKGNYRERKGQKR